MDATYEYMNEESIHPELICSICHEPFKDPRHTPCDETFCRECITNWIQTKNSSCPLCREPLSINALTQSTRMVRNMLDRLPVKCMVCGQTDLERGNFEEHIQKVCPKIVVFCSSADIKCPWTGPRHEFNQHVVDCRFIMMRYIIAPLIDENQQLKDRVNEQITGQQNEIIQLKEQVNQQRTQIEEHKNENQQLKGQVNQQTTQIVQHHNALKQLVELVKQQKTQISGHQNENQQFTAQIVQLKTQVNTYQREIQQLNEQLKQKDNQMTSMNSQSRE